MNVKCYLNEAIVQTDPARVVRNRSDCATIEETKSSDGCGSLLVLGLELDFVELEWVTIPQSPVCSGQWSQGKK